MKYKVKCSEKSNYLDVTSCLEVSGVKYAQKSENRPVVFHAKSDKDAMKILSGIEGKDTKCFENEVNKAFTIFKKDDDEWVEVPFKKEEKIVYDTSLSEKGRRIFEDLQSGENLREDDLRYLVWNYEIDRENGENRRWSRTVTSIVEIGGKTYSIDWEEGLTECQENSFYDQPIEVEKHEYEKTIKVTEWLPIEKVHER